MLSFLYNVVNNKEINEEFGNDQATTMAKFGLTGDQIQLITNAGDAGVPRDQDIDKIFEYLRSELKAAYPIAW